MESLRERSTLVAQTSKLVPRARIAPNNVPRVFVIMSVTPELLEGINPCNISIVRLMIPPARVTNRTIRSDGQRFLRYTQKKQPKGTKPTTFIRTSAAYA